METAVATIEQWRGMVLPDGRKSQTDRLEARRLLHSLVYTHFSGEELDQLCFDLGIVADDLGDGSHNHRVGQFVLLVIRQGLTGRALARLVELRPDAAWPDVV